MQYSSSSENYSSSLRDTPSKWNGRVSESYLNFAFLILKRSQIHPQNDKNYAYKKSSYQYSSSADNNATYQGKGADQNVDQLDALLEDLKQERQLTHRERDILPTGTSYRTL